MNKNQSDKYIVFYIKELSQYKYTIGPVVERLPALSVVIIHSTKLNRNITLQSPYIDKRITIIDLNFNSLISLRKVLVSAINSFIYIGHNSLIEFALSNLFIAKGINTINLQHGYYLETRKFVFSNKKLIIKKYFLYILVLIYCAKSNPILFIKNLFKFFNYKTEISFADINIFFDNLSAKKLKYVGKKNILGYPTSYPKISPSPKKGTASYIQQGFISHGVTGVSREEEKYFFKKMINLFRLMGFDKFQFFIHPRESFDDYLYLEKLGLKIFESKNNYSDLMNSDIVLGHYSTLFYHCISLGMNAIKLNYLEDKFDDSLSIDKLKSSDISKLYYKEGIYSEKISYDEYADRIVKIINNV